MAKLAAEVFEVLRTRVDLAVPVVTQLDPPTVHRPDSVRPWTPVGHVWDLNLVGMRSTGEFTSRLSIMEHRPDSWVGAPLPASTLDRRTGMFRWVFAGNEPAVTPDGLTFFSLFGVADNGELGVMDYWGAERHVRARGAGKQHRTTAGDRIRPLMSRARARRSRWALKRCRAPR